MDKRLKIFCPIATLLLFLPPFLLVLSFSEAQTQNMRFEHLTIESGLSSNQVNCIIQDSKEFMWFGTDHGLNKFDGYKFTVYVNDPNDPTSISHNLIYAICEDRSGNLWIGTRGGGLNQFDREKERFIRYQHDPANSNSLPDDFILSLCEDRDGELWIGTQGGLSRLSFSQVASMGQGRKAIFTNYKNQADDPNSLSYDQVSAIFEDQSGLLWLGTWCLGINIFDKKTGKFEPYVQKNAVGGSDEIRKFNKLIGECITSIYADPADSGKVIWVGTNYRLNKFDRIRNTLTAYCNDPHNPNSLQHNHISSIHKIKKGVFFARNRRRWTSGV